MASLSHNEFNISWFVAVKSQYKTFQYNTMTHCIQYSIGKYETLNPSVNLQKTSITEGRKLIVSTFLPLSPPGWGGIVLTVGAGRVGGCQTCGTHISVTAWWIFSVRSSVELSRPVVVHCHGHLPICPLWACPRAENLSNLAQIGSRLCGTHISETAGWIDPI